MKNIKRVTLTLMIFCVFFNFTGCMIENKETNEAEKLGMLKVNIPYSLNLSTSTAISSSGIESKYGKAAKIRNLKTKSYEIRNMADGSKLFVIYENDTNRAIYMWQLKKLLSREDFKNITPETSTIKDIVEIDPYTTIIEKSKDKGVSEHKLENNEVLTIDYIKKSDVWTVNKINFIINDPSEFTKTIIPEDLLLIS